MKALIVACAVGWLSQYAPGIMERTIALRQAGRTARDLPIPLPVVDGYIASLDCNEIGQVWSAEIDGKTFSLLVADCSGHASTTRRFKAQNILGEVDYATAKAVGKVGRGIRATVCRPTRSQS